MSSKATARDAELKQDFTKYLAEHPELRFWQALRNWSHYGFILASNDGETGEDTFLLGGQEMSDTTSELRQKLIDGGLYRLASLVGTDAKTPFTNLVNYIEEIVAAQKQQWKAEVRKQAYRDAIDYAKSRRKKVEDEITYYEMAIAALDGVIGEEK